MQASALEHRTLPLTVPSMRSPPVYDRLPSTVVPLPINVPIVLGATVLLPNIAASHRKSLLCAHFTIGLNFDQHRAHYRSLRKFKRPFHTLVVPES